MVDYDAADAVGCTCQAPSSGQVGVTWTGIAARVVVGQKNAGGLVKRSVRNDRAEWERATGLIAIMSGQVNAIPVGVDVRHPQALSSGIGLGEAAHEERARRFQPVQLERPRDTLIAHPT